MNKVITETATIFTREVVARRDLLILGAAIATLVVVLPFLPGTSGFDHAETRAASSAGLALALGAFLSIGLGTTVFGRDLSEQRLGFYFERPVSSTSIWLGRLLAVFVVILACELIVLLPGLTTAFSELQLTFSEISLKRLILGYGEPVSPAVLLIAIPAFLLLCSHSVSIMSRARTRWLLLDLFSLVTVGIGGSLLIHPFVKYGYIEAATAIATSLFAGLMVAFLIAAAVGVARGRTSVARTHRVVSLTLFGSSLSVIAVVALYAAWLPRFGPEDLTEYRLGGVSRDGRRISVCGYADGHKDIWGIFILSKPGGDFFQLPLGAHTFRGSQYSRTSVNGSYEVWGRRVGRDKTYTLWYANLENRPVEPVVTMISVTGLSNVEISPNGRSVAIREGPTLSLYDLNTSELLTVATHRELGGAYYWKYSGPNMIRIVARHSREGEVENSEEAFTVFNLAVEKGARPVALGAAMGFAGAFNLADTDLRFVAATNVSEAKEQSQRHEITIVYDLDTGDVVRHISGGFIGYLPDNRFWSFQEYEPDRVRITIESLRHEGELTEIDLENWPEDVFLGTTPTRDLVLAKGLLPNYTRFGFAWASIEIIDADTGHHHQLGSGFSITGASRRRSYGCNDSVFGFWGTSRNAALFQRADGNIFSWDPELKQLVQIAGRRSR